MSDNEVIESPAPDDSALAPPGATLPVVSGVVLLIGGALLAWQWLLAPSAAGAESGRGRPGAKSAGVPMVDVAIVTRGVLSATRGVPGEVVAPRRAVLKSRGEGPAQRVFVELGQQVRAGQTLVRLFAPELFAEQKRADADVAIRQAAADRAQLVAKQKTREAERRKKLHAEGALSRRMLIEAEEAAALAESDIAMRAAEAARAKADLAVVTARLSRAVVSAPFAGTIAKVFIDEGASLTPGADVVELVEPFGAKVRFFVPGRFQEAMTLGRAVEVSGPGGVLRANVIHVGAALDETLRMLPVEAAFVDAQEAPVAGGFAQVMLDVAFGDEALLVPRDALSGRGQERQVHVVDDAGRVSVKSVRVLYESDEHAAIGEQLSAGSRVVRSPGDLKDGAEVTVRPAPAITAKTEAGEPTSADQGG